jgi:hypothetical protein
LVLLVDKSAQVPSQSTVPGGQPHSPDWQVRLPPQASKQRPQFCLFDCRSTQTPPHCEKPAAAQRTAHVPALQMGAEGGQAFPQAPQFPLFESRFTHVPIPLRPMAHWV